MSTALAQALDILRQERDATVARVAALDVAIAQLVPLVNPQDVPAGRPVIIPDPQPATEGWVCDGCEALGGELTILTDLDEA